MKTMKKVGALLLALIMCLSMSMPAMAADSYSITVENSIGGVTYTVYKVFDATYAVNDDEETTGVSYTIKATDPWYSLVSAQDSPFTLTPSPDESYYVVSTNADETEIAIWFNSLDSDIPEGSQVGDSKQGTGGFITFELEEAGYYLVVPASDSYDSVAVSVDTAAPKATVVDKNQKPGEGGTDPKDPDWDGGFTKDDSTTSASIGDEIEYLIRSYVPSYDGERKVTSYTIVDTMGEGLTLDAELTDNYDGTYTVIDGVHVEIVGTGIENGEDITDVCKITVSYDENNETILTIYWEIEDVLVAVDDEGEFLIYPADAVVRITYTDEVNEVADDEDMTNTVAMSWKWLDPDDPDNPGEGSADDTPEVTVYTYGFDLKKTDGTDVLEGAQFTLQKQTTADDGTTSTNDITFVYDTNTDTYEEWDNSAVGIITTTITVGDGEVNVWGLGAGTYILTEIVAPDGYNLLDAPVTIVIAENETGWTVTVDDGTPASGVISSSSDHGVSSMPTVTIVNQAGTELPSTGGMGTTIFYMIGAILVCGAGILLITRRRMSREA